MGILQEFSVKGCRERSTIRTSMRVQFLHRHVRDTVIILEGETTPTHGAYGVICWFHGRN